MAMDFDSLAEEEEKRRSEERAKELASTLGLGSKQRAQATKEKTKLRTHRLESQQAIPEEAIDRRRQQNIELFGRPEGIHAEEAIDPRRQRNIELYGRPEGMHAEAIDLRRQRNIELYGRPEGIHAEAIDPRSQRNIELYGRPQGIHSPPVPKSSNGLPNLNAVLASIDRDEELENVKRNELANVDFSSENTHGTKSEGRQTDDADAKLPPEAKPHEHETRPSMSTSLVVQPLEDVIAAIDAEDEAQQLWHSYKGLAQIEDQKDRNELIGEEPADADWQDAFGKYEPVLSQPSLEAPDAADLELALLRRQRLMAKEKEAKSSRERKLKDMYNKAVHKRMADVDAVTNLTAMPRPGKISPASGASSSSLSKVAPSLQRIGVPKRETPQCQPAAAAAAAAAPVASRLSATAAESSQQFRTFPGAHTATQEAWLQPGGMVRLHSLKTNPELNGLVGMVEYQDEKNGRWVLCLESGETKSFKQQNIQPEMPESVQATNSKPASFGKPASTRFKLGRGGQ